MTRIPQLDGGNLFSATGIFKASGLKCATSCYISPFSETRDVREYRCIVMSSPASIHDEEPVIVSPQQQVANATKGFPWLVVYVGTQEGGQVQILQPYGPPEAQNPAHVRTSSVHEASLVLIEMVSENYRTIQQVMRSIQSKNYICFPILAVILRAPSESPRWVDRSLMQRNIMMQWGA